MKATVCRQECTYVLCCLRFLQACPVHTARRQGGYLRHAAKPQACGARFSSSTWQRADLLCCSCGCGQSQVLCRCVASCPEGGSGGLSILHLAASLCFLLSSKLHRWSECNRWHSLINTHCCLTMILAVPFIFDAGGVPSKQKYHVIVGHDTVMAEATFFGLPDGQGMTQAGTQIANTVLRYHTCSVPFPSLTCNSSCPRMLQYSTVRYSIVGGDPKPRH